MPHSSRSETLFQGKSPKKHRVRAIANGGRTPPRSPAPKPKRPHPKPSETSTKCMSRSAEGRTPTLPRRKTGNNSKTSDSDRHELCSMVQRIDSNEWSSDSTSTFVDDQQVSKDRLIKSLESEVEQQRLLRLTDAKQVEAKAARIKDWVTNKLKELEEQNEHLKLQNIHCNEQMDILKTRLEQMQATGTSRQSLTQSEEASSTTLSSNASITGQEEYPVPHPRTKSVVSHRPKSQPESGDKALPRHPLTRVMSEEHHDYSEIYSPTTEIKPQIISPNDSIKSRIGSGDSGLNGMSLPPPRPLHRFPSWEDRIYKVASEGLPEQGDLSRNSTEVKREFGYDIDVPVYAAVKGRASQIRSVPFTGDSSDSSDNEDGGDTGRGTTASSTSGDISTPSPRLTTNANTMNMFKYQVPNTLLTLPHHTNKKNSETSFEYEEHFDYQSAASTLETPRKDKGIEKSGYLNKLGGRIKSWKKRYFILKKGTFSFWKSQHDVHRKPQGSIILDQSCRISRAVGSNTFEIVTPAKTYYMTADNEALMEEWVQVLQNVVKINALHNLLSSGQRPTLQGWIKKVKHGHAKRVWCVLIGKMFVYFKNSSDTQPAGQLNMMDSRVEEVENISDSDSDENQSCSSSCTIGIFPNHVHQGPIYLIFEDKTEKEDWLYQLTVVSGGDPQLGTEFEKNVQKLMETDGCSDSPAWRHPSMVYSKDSISATLTTFTSDDLKEEALKLFKSLQLFMTVVMDSSGIDYHVALAANAIQRCIDIPELQPELLCALIKQTSRHSSSSSSKPHHGVQVKRLPSTKRRQNSFLHNASQLFSCDTNGVNGQKVLQTPSGPLPPPIQDHNSPTTQGSSSSSSNKNPSNYIFIQGWMFLALTVSTFVPKSRKLLWFLRAHLNRNKDPKTETGKYAAYCSRALERCVSNGPRQCKPSRMEVLSILLKNPHHHSLPHALPVHFLNDTYQVVGFDGSTTISEFLHELNKDIGCRPIDENGFTIFSDDPFQKNIDHALHLDDKVCDVISRWETALREKGLGKFESKKVIRFVYKNRLFIKTSINGEVDKERLFFTYQTSKQIVNGKFPLNKDLAFEIAALMSQIHFGDFEKQGENLSEALDTYFPSRYINGGEDRSDLEFSLKEKWLLLGGKNTHDCVRIMLTCTRKWQFFGSALFEVKMMTDKIPTDVYLAVNEDGISILDHCNMQMTHRYLYDQIVTFGGCQEDFMLDIHSDTKSTRESQDSKGPNTRLLFHTDKSIILDITLLVADYMNLIGKQASPGLIPPTPKMMARHQASRASSRSMTNKSNHSNSNTLDKFKKRQQLDSGVA